MRTLSRPAPIAVYAAAALFPALLLLAGAVWGGLWVWVALAWIGGISQIIDTLARAALPDPATDTLFPAADVVSLLLVAAHLSLLGAGLSALAGDGLGGAGRVGLFLGLGMYFGQVSNANAHELIHRSSRWLFRAGALVYVTLLFGHHVSAHRLVHHRHVATDDDPNTAAMGESFWHFWPRAWIGSFRAGLRAERDLDARAPGRINPYLIWTLGAAGCVLAVALIFGLWAAADYLALCAYAQMQLLLSDYVQHYGLRRARGSDGRSEPVNRRHSWDAPHLLSSLTMLNAPRHSDHHAHPARPWPALQLARSTEPRPLLPYSLPVMGALAMIPPLWRRVMDRRVLRMQMAGASTPRGAAERVD